MVILNEKLIEESIKGFGDAKKPLLAFRKTVLAAKWKTPHDIRQTFPRVSIISDYRYVFDIKGNSFRLIAVVNFQLENIRILWFGTHAEYNKINVLKL